MNATAAKKMEITSLRQIADMLRAEGKLHVRWSAGQEADSSMGGRSRDYVSGAMHAGLSAVDLDSARIAITPLQLVKYLGEYEFTRMRGAHITLYVISGAEVVGTDSDGYDSITAGTWFGLSAELIAQISAAHSQHMAATGCTYGNWTLAQRTQIAELEARLAVDMPVK